MTWLKFIKARLGFMPEKIMYEEQGDDLVIKAVKPEDKEAE